MEILPVCMSGQCWRNNPNKRAHPCKVCNRTPFGSGCNDCGQELSRIFWRPSCASPLQSREIAPLMSLLIKYNWPIENWSLFYIIAQCVSHEKLLAKYSFYIALEDMQSKERQFPPSELNPFHIAPLVFWHTYRLVLGLYFHWHSQITKKDSVVLRE